MVQEVIFINLFFVPVLSLYILCYKKQQSYKIMDLLLPYCMLTAFNIPLTKVFIFLVRRTSGIFISIDSGYYTLIALFSAYLLARCCAFLGQVHVEVEIVKCEAEADATSAD